MNKRILGFAAALVAAIVSPALAAPDDNPAMQQPPSISATRNTVLPDINHVKMEDLVRICGSTHMVPEENEYCRVVFRAMLISFYDVEGSRYGDFPPESCMPDYRKGIADFGRRIVEWLQKHPEDLPLTLADGQEAVIFGAYGCTK